MPTEYSVPPANQAIYIGNVPVWEVNGSTQITLARNGLASRGVRKFAYYDVNFQALCQAIQNGGLITFGAVQVTQSLYFPPVPGLVFKQIVFHRGDPSSINGLTNNIINGQNCLTYQMRYFDIEYAPLDYSELGQTGQVHIQTDDYEMPLYSYYTQFRAAGGGVDAGVPADSNLLVPHAIIEFELKSVPFIPAGWMATYGNHVHYSSTYPNLFGFAPVTPPTGGSFTGAGGTVMFKGMQETGPRQVFITPASQLGPLTYNFNWDINLRFEWLACGWNFMFNPAFGGFECVTYKGTTNLRYPWADLSVMLQQPNPTTAVPLPASNTAVLSGPMG